VVARLRWFVRATAFLVQLVGWAVRAELRDQPRQFSEVMDHPRSEACADLCLAGEIRESAFSHDDVAIGERDSMREEVEAVVLVRFVLALIKAVKYQVN
jgi:hypothetical protein